jgi:hypothetical protein
VTPASASFRGAGEASEPAISFGATPSASCPGKSAKRVFALDVPGIHVFSFLGVKEGVDGRDKPGHDDVVCFVSLFIFR